MPRRVNPRFPGARPSAENTDTRHFHKVVAREAFVVCYIFSSYLSSFYKGCRPFWHKTGQCRIKKSQWVEKCVKISWFKPMLT